MAGVAGEASGDDGARQRWLDGRSLGPALEHPPDEPDVDDLVVQGARARGFDALCAPLLHQAQQRVDLAHLGPGQRVVEQGRRVGADGHAVAHRHALQQGDVAHGVGRLVRGQVGGNGRATPSRHAGMDLDQLAPVEDAHQGAVGPSVDAAADEVARH